MSNPQLHLDFSGETQQADKLVAPLPREEPPQSEALNEDSKIISFEAAKQEFRRLRETELLSRVDSWVDPDQRRTL